MLRSVRVQVHDVTLYTSLRYMFFCYSLGVAPDMYAYPGKVPTALADVRTFPGSTYT